MAGSFTIVGGVAGAMIGSAAGPGGTLKGFEIGATIGAFLDAVSMQPAKTNGDMHWAGATYGTPVKRVWGKARLDCPVVWALRNTDGTYLFEHDVSGNGKKGPTTAHFHGSFAILVAQTGYTFADGTQVERAIVIDRVWMADKIVWQSASAAPISAWSNAVTYNFADAVTGSDSNVYTSTADANLNHDPTTPGTTYWSKVTVTKNADITWHPGPLESTFTQGVDSFISAHDSNATAWRGYTYGLIQDFDLFDIGNGIPQNCSVECHTAAALTVGDVLGDLFGLAGLTLAEYDFSATTDSVLGMVQEGPMLPQDMVNAILLAYGYDAVCVDGVNTAVKRGGSSAVTVLDADLSAALSGEKQPDRVESVILPDRLDLHSQMTVLYRNPNAGFKQAGELKNWPTAQKFNPVSIDTRLTLLPDDAAKMAGRLLATEWIEAGEEHKVSLPGKYSAYVPTDVVTMNYGGVPTRFKINKLEFIQNLVKWTMVRDEIAVLTRYETGDNTQQISVSPTTVISPTTFVIASPAQDLSDDFATYYGFYVWANGAAPDNSSFFGASTGWKGGRIWYTFDAPGPGRHWVDGGDINVRSTFGPIVTTALADGASAGAWDTTHHTDVRHAVAQTGFATAQPMGLISRGSQALVLDGYNNGYIGNEIVGIATTDGNDPTEQIGPNIVRGMRGSPFTGHTLGEQFACAPSVRQTTKVKVDSSQDGNTVYVQVLSPGQVIDDSIELSCVISAPTKPYPENNPPVDPVSVSAGTPVYSGLNETVPFTLVAGANPPAGQTYNWEYSTSGSSWSTMVTGQGASYVPPAISTGTLRVRVQAQTSDGRTGSWVSSTDTTYAAPTGSTCTAPDSVSATAVGYSGSTENAVFAPVFTTSSPVANQTYQSQESTDGGATWKGPDGTSSSYFIGAGVTRSLTSGVKRMRFRAVAQVGGATSAWVSSSDVMYVAPTNPSGYQVDLFSGDASTTVFTLTYAPLTSAEFVFVDKALQIPVTDYTISGTTLTFASAPWNGSQIVVRYPH